MPVIETADRGGSSDVDISDDDEYADAPEVMEDDDYFLSQGELLQGVFKSIFFIVVAFQASLVGQVSNLSFRTTLAMRLWLG